MESINHKIREKMHVYKYNSDDLKTKKKVNKQVEQEKIETKNSYINDNPSTSKKINTLKRNIIRINSDSNENIPKQTTIANNKKTKKTYFSKIKRSRIIYDSDEDTSFKRIKHFISSENMINNDNFSADKEIKSAKENLKKKHISNVNKTAQTRKITCKSARASITNQNLNNSIDKSFHYDSDAGILSKDMSLKCRNIAKQNFYSKMEIVNVNGKESLNRYANITPKNIHIEDSNKQKSEENTIDNNTTLKADKSTKFRRSLRTPKPRQSFWKFLYNTSYNSTDSKQRTIYTNLSQPNKSINLESPKKVKQNFDCNDGSSKRKPKSNKKQLLSKENIENLAPICDSTENSFNKNNATSQDNIPSFNTIKKNSRKKINASTNSEIYLSNSNENEDKNQYNLHKNKFKKNMHLREKKEDGNQCDTEKNIKKPKKHFDIQNKKIKNLLSNKNVEEHSTVMNNNEDIFLINSATKENKENIIFDKIYTSGRKKKNKSTIRRVKNNTSNLLTNQQIPVSNSKAGTIPEITTNTANNRNKFEATSAHTYFNLLNNKDENLNLINSEINDRYFSFKDRALKEQLPIVRRKGLANIPVDNQSVYMECYGNFPQETYATIEQPFVSTAKCFENNFCTAGMMEIKCQQTKNWDCAFKHHLYFIILEGTAEVAIDNITRIMRIGDSFFVPTKSFYYIANVDAKKNLLINFVRYKCEFN